MGVADDMDYEDDPPHPRYVYRKGGGKFDGAIEKIGMALIISGLLGFVGLVFAVNGSISNLRESQAVLTSSQQFLQQQINDVKVRQDRMEGRVFRGGSYTGDIHADERQPK